MRGVPFPQPEKAPQHRDGIGFREDSLTKWGVAGGFKQALIVPNRTTAAMKKEGDYVMGDTEQAYIEATKTLSEANEAYNKVLNSFRSTIKNDLASISASGVKVQAETAKMRQAYTDAVTTLTSKEMISAIENAERLATALQAISSLQNHSITFAVLDKKTPI